MNHTGEEKELTENSTAAPGATESGQSAAAPDAPLRALESIAQMEAAVEAILCAAGYPVRYTKLSEVLGLGVPDVRNLLEHMQPRFDDTTCGLQLLLLPETCQICTKEAYAPYIREALGIRRGGNLSASSMEVLAVIAYNQPITRTFIDNIRGVDSSYAVGSLLDKGLIEAVGRLEAVGRPMLYGTTDKFLRVFGIRSLAELPETEALAVAAQVEKEKEQGAQKESSPSDAREGDVPSDAQPDAPEGATREAGASEVSDGATHEMGASEPSESAPPADDAAQGSEPASDAD